MNEIVVIGYDHYNTLGIIRSLGEAGFSPSAIVYSEKRTPSFVLKSKYLKCAYQLEACDKRVIALLHQEFTNKVEPTIIIGASDLACLTIDANIESLKDFICANCGNEENRISHWMNKQIMNEMAESVGIQVPNSIFVSAGDSIPYSKIKYPCILKPLESAYGNKSDITICENEDALKNAFRVFEHQHIDILIQKFVKAEYELGIMGCSYYHSNEVALPDVIIKQRFSNKSAVFAEIRSSVDADEQLKKLLRQLQLLIQKIKYRGIFDVDVIYANGQYYFIEVNLRNGAYGYALSRAGCNFAASWVNEIVNRTSEAMQVKRMQYLMCEFSDFKMRKANHVSTAKWFRDFCRSKHMVLQVRDWMPAVAYVLNKVKNK